MTAQELSDWYTAQTSDHQPVLPVPQELIDEDWRIGWE
jgi:hypothetical protein